MHICHTYIFHCWIQHRYYHAKTYNKTRTHKLKTAIFIQWECSVVQGEKVEYTQMSWKVEEILVNRFLYSMFVCMWWKKVSSSRSPITLTHNLRYATKKGYQSSDYVWAGPFLTTHEGKIWRKKSDLWHFWKI